MSTRVVIGCDSASRKGSGRGAADWLASEASAPGVDREPFVLSHVRLGALGFPAGDGEIKSVALGVHGPELGVAAVAGLGVRRISFRDLVAIELDQV